MGTGKRVAVGVSIAGDAEATIIDDRGNILLRGPIKMLRGRSIAATLGPIVHMLDEMHAYARGKRYHVCGVGISLPGTVDEEARRPLAIPLLPALNGFPLCNLLETRYALPARLFVDVDAALLGENRYGAGKDLAVRRLFLLSVNAVVGASLLIDGEVARPTQPCVGHVSHVTVAASGPRCSCGKRGCINSLLSLDAMRKMVQRALQREEETSLARRLLDRSSTIPQIIAEEARRGDLVAIRLCSEVGRWLNVAATRYITLLQPDLIILGGDIASASDLLSVSPLASPDDTTASVATRIKVIPACLGRDAALLGIAAHFNTR